MSIATIESLSNTAIWMTGNANYSTVVRVVWVSKSNMMMEPDWSPRNRFLLPGEAWKEVGISGILTRL